MKPLSDDLRSLLDQIAAALAAGVTADALLAELERRWRAERPDDIASLEALLRDLRNRPDQARLAAAAAELAQDRARLATETAVETPRTLGAFPQPGGWVYPVFFGTNRAPVDRDTPDDGFSARRGGSVTYGRCDVWVPRTHHFGETGTAWWKRWLHLQIVDDHLRLCKTAFLSDPAFWAALQGEMTQVKAGKPYGLVYLHGYNVSFHDAVIRAAQVGFDLRVGGATALFSWPSHGTLEGYAADAASIEASESAITQFLADFARRSGAAVVHLVAHSMGNRGLLRSLQRLAADAQLSAGVKFGQIFLAAPDVDRDLFLDLARLYPQFSERTTLYGSPKDKAVALSAWLHDAPRAGYFPPPTVANGVDRLDTVEVPGFNLDVMGHGYFAEAEAVLYDMVELMLHGTPPPRTRLDPERIDGCWIMRR